MKSFAMNEMRFYCQHCDLLLKPHELDVKEERTRSEHFGQIATTSEYALSCGACGGDLEERCVCERCEDAPSGSGSAYCEACAAIVELEEADSLPNVLLSIAHVAL